VANNLQCLGTLLGNNLHLGTILQLRIGVDEPVIDFSGNGSLGQASADRGGKIEDCCALIQLPC
jgi:hypothetical protein